MTQVRGSITVFLTLVMVCIISLVGTMLDLARFEMADHLAYNALVTAVDSELTNYCKEIYEDYKIFLLDGGQKEENMNGEEYVKSVRDYLTYSFEPEKNIQLGNFSLPLSTTDFLAIELKGCTLKGQTMITDQEGEIFQHQVEEYMKYHVPGELAESLLSKLNLLQNTKTTMSVFRKKMAVEEKSAKISESIMKLITLLEGLTFDDGELEMTKDHYIVIQDYFGKQFCTEKVGPNAVAINHNLVWDSLHDKYTNPVTCLTAIQVENEKINALEKECEEIKKQSEDEQDEKICKKLKEELSKREEKIEELKNKIGEDGLPLVDKAKGMQEKIVLALNTIDGLRGQKEACEKEMNDFELYLNTKKTELDEGSYKAANEELTELKEYLWKVDETGVDTSIIGDVMAMKNCLKTNLVALNKTIAMESHVRPEIEKDYFKFKVDVKDALESYKSYTIRPLHFDYSRLNTKKKEESPVKGLGNLVEDGICHLILKDTTSLSKQSLSKSNLPSQSMAAVQVGNEKKDQSEKLADQISDQDSNLSSSMEEYESICQKAEPEGGALNDMARRLLLNSYGVSYFKNYATQYNIKKKEARPEKTLSKPTVMEYEQEYLIIGGDTDDENVKDIVNRTLFIRTAMNYLSLLTDQTARGKALATATAMVGFTGCGPLVTVVKHVILMGWGFEEALVDVGALMQGKSVPLFKKASNFSVRFEELLSINKTLIQTKIKRLPEKGDSLLSLTYEDYLNFYMLMVGPDTLSYRMMDLIQENTRVRYKKDFLMNNGVFAMEMGLDCEVPNKFISLPLIKQFIGQSDISSSIQISTEYSY